jgi:hypothetical protein
VGGTGFTAGNTYTNVFSVAHNSDNSVTIASQITGPSGFSYSYSTPDTLNSNTVDFDTYAFRPASDVTTATNFTFTLFEIQETNATTVVSRIPLKINYSSGNVIFTWTNNTFNLYAAPNATGTYSKITGAATGFSQPASNNYRFFRLLNQ